MHDIEELYHLLNNIELYKTYKVEGHANLWLMVGLIEPFSVIVDCDSSQTDANSVLRKYNIYAGTILLLQVHYDNCNPPNCVTLNTVLMHQPNAWRTLFRMSKVIDTPPSPSELTKGFPVSNTNQTPDKERKIDNLIEELEEIRWQSKHYL